MTPTTNLSPNRTSLVKGVRTAVFAVVGTAVGLVVAVWGVPGVPEVVINYLQTNAVQLLVTIGVPSGLVSWLWNAYEARRVIKTF